MERSDATLKPRKDLPQTSAGDGLVGISTMVAALTAAAWRSSSKKAGYRSGARRTAHQGFPPSSEHSKRLSGRPLGVKIPDGHPLASLPEGLVQQNAKRRFAHSTLLGDHRYSHIT